jgi:hypothetical protein|tara:strand:+ start:395 stop:829 length:435 start_codon:yes stop_codon:yes gene_type:complete
MAKTKAKSKPKAKKTKTRKTPGLDMDFISMKTLSDLTVEKRINTILKKVKEGHMVVLDAALDADEEAKLVTATMHGIDGEFTGIEFCTLEKSNTMAVNVLMRLLSSIFRASITKPGLTFVGPSYLIEKIKRDPDAFYVSTRRKN